VITDVLGAAPGEALLALAEGMRGTPFVLLELLSGLREDHLVSLDGDDIVERYRPGGCPVRT
jgi:hypothetical protein